MLDGPLQNTKSLVRVWESNGLLLIEPAHFIPHLRQTHPRLEARNGHEFMMYVLGQIVIELAEGHPQISGTREMYSSRQNSNDRVALVVERYAAAYHTRIAADTALPQSVAQDHNWRASRPVFFREK